MHRGVVVVLAVGLFALHPAVAAAHEAGVAPDTWYTAWDADPLVVFCLGAAAWFYTRGLARLRRRCGRGRVVSRTRAAAYFASLAVVLVALLSPLDALGNELSSCHMVQHMLLVAVAAPLFVLGSPMLVTAWGVPELWRGGGGVVRAVLRAVNSSLLWQPAVLWVLFAATLWGWHHPAAYQAALRDPLVHDAQHLSFFATACLFWRKCLDATSPRRSTAIAAVPYLLATSVQASLLGVFLTLSPTVWYADYVPRTAPWGLSPLEDQQLAGLIMWMPACLAYPVAAALLFGRWLHALPRSTPAAPRLLTRSFCEP